MAEVQTLPKESVAEKTEPAKPRSRFDEIWGGGRPIWNWDPRQEAVRRLGREFCEREVVPVAKKLDQVVPQQFAFDLYYKVAKAGFVGFSMPVEYGGGGRNSLEYNTLVETLAYYDLSTCLLAAVGELATHPIIHFASEEQKRKYVPKCASGELISAYLLTEPEAGSDAANQRTVAVPDGDHYVVNGEKIFIMHGDVAHLGVLFCRIQEEGARDKVSALIVDLTSPGVKRTTLQQKMGIRAATTGRVWFENVRVPKENLLGEKGRGFRYALATLDSARIGVAAQGVGMAQRAFDEAVGYAKKRIAFGNPIAKLQAIQWMIADMATRIEAARVLTYKAALLQEQGVKFSLEGSEAKVCATETARFCVDRCMQIHGGYGYIGEFTEVEKLYRDQRILEIYEGTSEVQRLVIAKHYCG